MKVQNISNVDKFFEMIGECKGKVELVSDEGDRLNLKSKLCKYVAIAKLFSNGNSFDIEIVAYEHEDVMRIMKFMQEGE